MPATFELEQQEAMTERLWHNGDGKKLISRIKFHIANIISDVN